MPSPYNHSSTATMSVLQRMFRPPTAPSPTRSPTTAASKSSTIFVVKEKRSTPLVVPGRRSALDDLVTLTELAGEVSNMLQCTPAAAAASLLAAALKTIAAVKVNSSNNAYASRRSAFAWRGCRRRQCRRRSCLPTR
ncbi:hypothetical protein FA95DRAFT_852399 [Auriscalpium vulgare]|uniref:Uncharacterized protein n=1 Tax=Auriscalpium vulgare TaxID=40419 RepID=A0ACB8R9D4_9AGAM|nr:hypothetical protein FA95DRAFT_852399 [Auriscalpium vulgare]